MNGFKTFNEFVNAWIKGEYPKFENNKQAEKMLVLEREALQMEQLMNLAIVFTEM